MPHLYWQNIQKAIDVDNRRAEWKNRNALRASIRISVSNQLDEPGATRIEAQARAAWTLVDREREGARLLISTPRDQLGLDVVYDPQFRIIQLPERRVVADEDGALPVYYLGRAPRYLSKITCTLGRSR